MRLTKSKNEKRGNLKTKNTQFLKDLKRGVKGITLLALVVTIIVLLILAGVALSLTVGDNGLFRRAENAANTWQMAEINEQIEMDKASNFIEDYMNGGSGITWHEDVPIPDGFYYVGGEENTGLIISDSPDDANKGVDYHTTSFKGNQFVWVPVEHPENYFIDETATLNTNATGTEEENQVTTNVYSNLTKRNGDQSEFTVGIPGVEETEEGDYVIREPDVLSYYDTEEQYYKTILNFDSKKVMAESFVAEYKAMSDSIKKYKGFYIGRYELSGSVEAPTEKAGASLISQNWYDSYKACKNVVTGKENVKSTMIYGVQWDATMEWLKATKFQDDPSKVDTDSSSWGNYSTGSKIDTGSNTTYEANGIFDLAGNCFEWTQEAFSAYYRMLRGGYYNDSGSNGPASDRGAHSPNDSNSYYSSRATLYMP